MKKFYFIVCNIYSKLFTFLENIFYKNPISNNSKLLTRGYETLDLKKKLVIKNKEIEIKNNPYLQKSILSNKEIDNLINNLFIENNLCEIITSKTGFNYSVDFLVCYKTFNIPISNSDSEVYANNWHNDKPFSENTLKLIIPQNDIEIDGGGIEILNRNDSKTKDQNFLNKDKIFKMQNKVGEILVFYPNLCYHKAGIPKIGNFREQIMIQLNPAKDWCINNSIYYKQMKIEPKFPNINYFFDKKKKLVFH